MRTFLAFCLSILALGTVFGLELVLMLPSFDLGNAPIEVFCYDHDYGKEITVIFKDEDFPNPILDVLYDTYRFFKWGRVEDVETFFIRKETVFFPDDYASVTSFFQTENLHTRREISIDYFETLNGNIVVYVNTWNHMFSEKPLPGILYIPFFFKPREGTRGDVEKLYSWRH